MPQGGETGRWDPAEVAGQWEEANPWPSQRPCQVGFKGEQETGILSLCCLGYLPHQASRRLGPRRAPGAEGDQGLRAAFQAHAAHHTPHRHTWGGGGTKTPPALNPASCECALMWKRSLHRCN